MGFVYRLAYRGDVAAGQLAVFEEPSFPVARRPFKLRFLGVLPSFCLAGVFLFQCFVADRSSGEPPGSGDPLVQAQIENQKAQARYYTRQSDRRGFWRSLREFGWPVGVIAVGVAAIVAVGLNQRANLRSRSDTEFYETIKLFSQNENPPSRLMAAGVLAQMAVRRKRFYECAFDELSLGLLSEPQSKVQDAIRLAVGRLVKKNPKKSLPKLDAINRASKLALSESLYRFFLARGGAPPDLVSENDWIEAEKITNFDRPALKSVFESLPKDRVEKILNEARKMGCGGKGEPVKEESAGLANAAEQLRLNVKSISLDGHTITNVTASDGRPIKTRARCCSAWACSSTSASSRSTPPATSWCSGEPSRTTPQDRPPSDRGPRQNDRGQKALAQARNVAADLVPPPSREA